ncbi:MAG TPA: DUF4129 domain-containing protein [Pseudonocardiaceae bacterium]|nr:DUF4129 domain-containing protein [Pseudonocardiaceae bacterium]
MSWFVLAAGGLCVVVAGLVLLPVIWWERVVGLLIVLVVVVLVAVTAWWAIHLATSSPAGSGTGQAATSTGSPPASGPAALGGSGVSGAVLLMAGGAALAVFVIILLAWWRQRQRRLARPSGSRVVSAGLADAVTAARSALSQTARSGGDRAAILACYAALEQALVEHGVTRRGADTPSEHLRRAAQAGVLPANAAHVLLGLFHRARFSDHPVGPADRARAERALEEAAACLREASG